MINNYLKKFKNDTNNIKAIKNIILAMIFLIIFKTNNLQCHEYLDYVIKFIKTQKKDCLDNNEIKKIFFNNYSGNDFLSDKVVNQFFYDFNLLIKDFYNYKLNCIYEQKIILDDTGKIKHYFTSNEYEALSKDKRTSIFKLNQDNIDITTRLNKLIVDFYNYLWPNYNYSQTLGVYFYNPGQSSINRSIKGYSFFESATDLYKKQTSLKIDSHLKSYLIKNDSSMEAAFLKEKDSVALRRTVILSLTTSLIIIFGVIKN